MKTIIIVFMSMITTVFYAQTADEVELANRKNSLVLSAIPSLAGKDYFILEVVPTNISVISKINNNYIYYNIEIGGLGETTIAYAKPVSYKPILDKIFINFVSKAGVKRYFSEISPSGEGVSNLTYFAIYKNGVKTFDLFLPLFQNSSIESPIDDETLVFLYVDVFVYPDKL